VEKLGRMVAEGKKTQPGRREGELVWSRFYSIDVHPRTPLVGMLHATLVLQFYADGTGFAGGWLGVMNGTRVDEDMAALTGVVDDHFASHGRNPGIYRSLIVKGTEDTISEFRRRPDPSGVSFYGPPVFPGDVARSYEFIEGLFGKFTDAYLDLIPRRTGAPVTAEDVARQDAMRKRWLVDQLYSDPFASKLVPFEVWSLANVPPTVRF
jgi:coproporphyrinogen III oxidase